jgi:ElaB/YqjD/DUF883 family membrane-anchored ribosome-binding protein
MKAKPIIIIIITLAIGFVIGMLVSAQLRYHRLKPVRVFFSEQRFREGFYNVIQPDEKQKATIDELLDKYAKMNGSYQNDFRKRLDSIMKEFWKELEPTLTKDQLTRLREMEQRRMDMWRQNQRNRGDSLNYRDRGRREGMPPSPGHRSPNHEGRDSARL